MFYFKQVYFFNGTKIFFVYYFCLIALYFKYSETSKGNCPAFLIPQG